jgi:hypothetical protein
MPALTEWSCELATSLRLENHEEHPIRINRRRNALELVIFSHCNGIG